MPIFFNDTTVSCARFNTGRPCNFRTCPFIHSNAEREEILRGRRQQHYFINSKTIPNSHESRTKPPKCSTKYTKKVKGRCRRNVPAVNVKDDEKKEDNVELPARSTLKRSPSICSISEFVTPLKRSPENINSTVPILVTPESKARKVKAFKLKRGGTASFENNENIAQLISKVISTITVKLPPSASTHGDSLNITKKSMKLPTDEPLSARPKYTSPTKACSPVINIVKQTPKKRNRNSRTVNRSSPSSSNQNNATVENTDTTDEKKLESIVVIRPNISQTCSSDTFKKTEAQLANVEELELKRLRTSPAKDSFQFIKRTFPEILSRVGNGSVPKTSELSWAKRASLSSGNNYDEDQTGKSLLIKYPLNEPLKEITRDIDEINQFREELRLWEPERLQWIDSLSSENRYKYIRNIMKNKDETISLDIQQCETLKTSGSGSSKQKTFNSFTKLPAEIRNQIWEYARQDCSSTCYVQLNVKQEPGCIPGIVNGRRELIPLPTSDAKFTYLYDVPGLFGACRESRSIVKHLYGRPKMSAFNIATQKSYPSGEGSCILNYEQDRVFFISSGSATQLPELVKYLKRDERKQIKHLAIPLRDYFHEEVTVVRCLVHFPNLETLDLVIGDGEDDLERIGNLDYCSFLRRSLERHHNIDDLELDEKDQKKWSIPIIKMEYVSESQARIWKIDGLKWETTSRSIPPQKIEA